MGYAADTVRQGFTGYEKDTESDLNFAQNRYYNPKHGRFTNVDPLMASAQTGNPKTWNRYIYALNNPLKLIDSTGLAAGCPPLYPDCKTDEGGDYVIDKETGEKGYVNDDPPIIIDSTDRNNSNSGGGGPMFGMVGCFSEGCRQWATSCKSNPLACDVSPGVGVLGVEAQVGEGILSRAFSRIAKFFGFGGKKLLKPVSGIINIGGAGEVPSVTNVNALIDRTAQGIENLVVADGAQIGNLFEAGSANSVIANRLPYSTVNWEGVAEGAHQVLAPGGRVQINVWTTGAQDLSRLESAFKAAGFQSVSVTGSGTGTIINAVR